MALMFPRLARNFAKNGYYPTDESTLERVLSAIRPAESGMMRILDPCGGEGVALAEAAHALDRARVQAFGIEYDRERAGHMATIIDRTLQGDLMDTVVSPRSMGLLFLNPPYGDLVSDHSGASRYKGKGRPRLEKLFYQRTIHTLQYGGIMVLIIPRYSLDKELTGWLVNHFTDLQVFGAVAETYKQVVIMGKRIRSSDAPRDDRTKQVRADMLSIGAGESEPEVIPDGWSLDSYTIPAITGDIPYFYRISLEPVQLSQELDRIKGQWSDFNAIFSSVGRKPRPPVRQLSPWHLALSLAGGAISGVVTSPAGRCLVVKGDTHKEKSTKTEFTENEDGSVTETRILIDRFVPVIRAWDMTPASEHFGQILTISSASAETPAEPKFDLGRLVMTHAINCLLEEGTIDREQLLQLTTRHRRGEWGDASEQDACTNERALQDGERLMSVWQVSGVTIWIITEWDRSATTVMLPQDY